MAKKPVFSDEDVDTGVTPATAPTRPITPKPEEADPAQTAAAPGRDASGHQRPPTRIHGYGTQSVEAAEDRESGKAPGAAMADMVPVVGWLVVIDGPGRGAAVGLVSGMNSVGRGEENTAMVDFGDDTISREPHAFVTYDNEGRNFHVGHAGKTNLVRLNDAPVLETQPLADGDRIRIGATTMRFVALCGPDFDWSET